MLLLKASSAAPSSLLHARGSRAGVQGPHPHLQPARWVAAHASSSEGGPSYGSAPEPEWKGEKLTPVPPPPRDAKKRRRGRPAHLRSPDDSPLRDGNRDMMVGLLTERAAKTLLIYLAEMNPIVYQWLFRYIETHPIPRKGAPWDDISGETFLRTLLSQPMSESKMDLGRDSLFDNTASIGVDPRALAQRIMDIRVQLSREFIQDLGLVKEENQALLQETLMSSLNSAPAQHPIPTIKVLPPLPQKPVVVHPELLNSKGELDEDVAKQYPEMAAALQRQREQEQQKKEGKDGEKQ